MYNLTCFKKNNSDTKNGNCSLSIHKRSLHKVLFEITCGSAFYKLRIEPHTEQAEDQSSTFRPRHPVKRRASES